MIKPCQICLQFFDAKGTAVCCSPECRKIYKKLKLKEWRKDHSEHIKNYRKNYYETNAPILRQKAVDHYYENVEKSRKRSRDYARKKRAEDNESVRTKNRAWRITNHEHVKAYNSQWAKDHPENIKRHNKTHYEKDIEANRAKGRETYALNPQKFIDRASQWRRSNPQKRTLYDMRRDARKAGLPDTMTPAQVKHLFQYWSFACAACGKEEGLFGVKLVLDHWIPLASPECPGTIVTNMILLCNGPGGCNTSKIDTDPGIWLRRRFGMRKAAAIERRITAYFQSVAEPKKA